MQSNRIHACITDGDRGMVKSDHQGKIPELWDQKSLRKPLQLVRAKPARRRCNPVAVEQHQPHTPQHQIGGSRCKRAPQNGIHENRVIVVAGHQSDLAAHVLTQGPPQSDITTPALVLT